MNLDYATVVKWVHLAAALLFAVQVPVALLTDLKGSVPYLVFLSLWALVASHWSAWQAARAEEVGRRDAPDDD